MQEEVSDNYGLLLLWCQEAWGQYSLLTLSTLAEVSWVDIMISLTVLAYKRIVEYCMITYACLCLIQYRLPNVLLNENQHK